jgi:hypothetical protein
MDNLPKITREDLRTMEMQIDKPTLKVKLDTSAVEERIEEIRVELGTYPESVQELFWEDLKRRILHANNGYVKDRTLHITWESHHVDLALAEARLCLG